jgi:hypothetical protein
MRDRVASQSGKKRQSRFGMLPFGDFDATLQSAFHGASAPSVSHSSEKRAKVTFSMEECSPRS